ncbi:unnamed protein product [Adineta steineri]|uniref:F-box domain-containing protein n=1 Tax=Adineta steineri TaxID=433720 RepID=A0A814NN37_9BILA|nr:unnamed protein product [Adineta steineri]CAF3845517.1 unnamed protein product [Adineta steineri]
MNFELLPNEIVLTLFDYFRSIDLLKIFFGLNTRFNLLLYKQFRRYRLNCLSLSKHIFDDVCQQHLPFLIDRIITLKLSDDSSTTGQIDHFLSYISSLSLLTNLRYLTLLNIHSRETLIKLVNEFSSLSNVTYLNISFRCYENDEIDFQMIIDNIWSLPKLIHCRYTIYIRNLSSFLLPTKVCSTLKNFYLFGQQIQYNKIFQLYECAPSLKHLRVSVTINDNVNENRMSSLLTLTKLRMVTFHSSIFMSLFEYLPNLCHLQITLSCYLITGDRWEHLICNYLPKLKTFKLRMSDDLPVNDNIEERADELINSFRSSFWIKERRWFVRCYTLHKKLHLETLSKQFFYMEDSFPHIWRSTYPNDDHKIFYNSITHISVETFFNQSFPSYIRLHNLDTLHIKFPLNDQFWLIVSSLKKLRRLHIKSFTKEYQYQLQRLLNQASGLQFLSIDQDGASLSFDKFMNKSIHELDFRCLNEVFNEEECINLCQSSLGIQCKILTISVTTRQSILILIQNMKNLQALHIQYNEYTSNSNEIIQ